MTPDLAAIAVATWWLPLGTGLLAGFALAAAYHHRADPWTPHPADPPARTSAVRIVDPPYDWAHEQLRVSDQGEA